MTDFKDQWDLDMAMEVLMSSTVDGKTWSEAVRWLILYGPPHVRQLIGEASHFATSQHFPELKPAGYDDDGNPCYDVSQLAEILGAEAAEVLSTMVEIEEESDTPVLLTPDRIHKIH